MDVRINYKSYPGPVMIPASILSVTAKYVTQKITITPETISEDLIKTFKVEDLMIACATALDKWVKADKALEGYC